MRKRGTLVEKLSILLALAWIPQAYAFKLISFDGKPTRWSKRNLTYVLDSKPSTSMRGLCSDGRCVDVSGAVRNSFNQWSNVPGVDIQFNTKPQKAIGKTGYDGENSVVWVDNGWKNLSFSPPSSALAVTISTYKTSNYEIVDSDIHFNGEYFLWGDAEKVGSNTNVVDIENIATHEIGHFIGLDHSSEDIFEPVSDLYLATMFFASGPGEMFRRDLNVDDMEAVRHLYPHDHHDVPIVDVISPNTVDTEVSGQQVVRISGDHFSGSTSVVMARNGDHGDIAGRIVSQDENVIDVAFDLWSVRAGRYDIVVANSFDRQDRVQDGLTVLRNGEEGFYGDEDEEGLYSQNTGGCAVSNPNASGSKDAGLLLLILPLVLIAWARTQLDGKRRKNPQPFRFRLGHRG